MKTTISIFTILTSMLLIDAVWLKVMFKPFYSLHMGHLMSQTMKMGPAFLFYVLYAFALNYLVVTPELRNNFGYCHLLCAGLLFGLTAYGTYDLTNQATLQNWPWVLTIVDMIWGSILTGVSAVIAVYVTRYFV